jgi:hypothetical protein
VASADGLFEIHRDTADRKSVLVNMGVRAVVGLLVLGRALMLGRAVGLKEIVGDFVGRKLGIFVGLDDGRLVGEAVGALFLQVEGADEPLE